MRVSWSAQVVSVAMPKPILRRNGGMTTTQDYQAAEQLLRRPARPGELVSGDKVRPQRIGHPATRPPPRPIAISPELLAEMFA